MTERKDAPSSGVILRAMKRDRFTCTYCGSTGSESELQVDHIIPIAEGGSHHIANLTTSCRSCNQSKGKKLDWQPKSKKQRGEFMPDYFIHIIDEGGLVQYQGSVLEKYESHWLVQRYSFFDGSPTDVIPVPVSDIFNPAKVRMYTSMDRWLSDASRDTRTRLECG